VISPWRKRVLAAYDHDVRKIGGQAAGTAVKKWRAWWRNGTLSIDPLDHVAEIEDVALLAVHEAARTYDPRSGRPFVAYGYAAAEKALAFWYRDNCQRTVEVEDWHADDTDDMVLASLGQMTRAEGRDLLERACAGVADAALALELITAPRDSGEYKAAALREYDADDQPATQRVVTRVQRALKVIRARIDGTAPMPPRETEPTDPPAPAPAGRVYVVVAPPAAPLWIYEAGAAAETIYDHFDAGVPAAQRGSMPLARLPWPLLRSPVGSIRPPGMGPGGVGENPAGGLRSSAARWGPARAAPS
jgi:hypothetical protein